MDEWSLCTRIGFRGPRDYIYNAATTSSLRLHGPVTRNESVYSVRDDHLASIVPFSDEETCLHYTYCGVSDPLCDPRTQYCVEFIFNRLYYENGDNGTDTTECNDGSSCAPEARCTVFGAFTFLNSDNADRPFHKFGAASDGMVICSGCMLSL